MTGKLEPALRRSSLKKLTFLVLLATYCSRLHAAPTLSENFSNVNSLFFNGWIANNRSNPAGLSSWFQGNTAVFSAQSGAADSYVAANFEAAGAAGEISDWLITPSLVLSNGDTVSFFTRSAGAYPDRLELRYAATNTSFVGLTPTSVGDFSNLLLSINPAGTASGYPASWTRYTASVSGLSGSVTGRLAFRYLVSNTSIAGDYIGIDTLAVDSSVPEPATFGLFLGAASVMLSGVFLRGSVFKKRMN